MPGNDIKEIQLNAKNRFINLSLQSDSKPEYSTQTNILTISLQGHIKFAICWNFEKVQFCGDISFQTKLFLI